jgi:serine phosphatase RsbU (regulator of sigma subunit)
MKKLLLIIISLFFINITNGQIQNIGAIPFINNYPADEYGASRQNWCGAQDKRGLLYFGNTNGSILEFDGQNWRQIKISDYAITSICIDNNNRIYIGGKNVIGYLKPTKDGQLKFCSLKDKIPENYQDFDKIWDIFITKDSSIFFQTFDEIFIFDKQNDSLKVLSIDDYYKQGLFLMSFKVNDVIYIYSKYKGLYLYENKDLKFIEQSSIFANSFVRAILPYSNNTKIIFTWYDGTFILSPNNDITPIKTPIDNILLHNTYRANNIHENYFAFQLYRGGLLITDQNFKIIQFLKSPEYLVNDKIYRIFTDKQDNLWLCTDNGIASIYPFSPITIFNGRYGFDNESICYDALLKDSSLFVATESGVFYKKWSEYEDKQNYEKFNLINNSRGNIKTRQIDTINQDIIASASNGLYYIQNLSAEYILADRNVRTFCQANDNSDVIIGISGVVFIFKKIKGKWQFIKDIQDIGGQYIVQDEQNNYWISDLITGIRQIKFDPNYDSLMTNKLFSTADSTQNGLPITENIRIFKLGKKIVFTTEQGIYNFDYDTKKFIPDQELNKIIGKNTTVTFITADKQGNIWYKKQIKKNNQLNWELHELKKTDTGYTEIHRIFLPLKNKIFSFKQINDSLYLIGGPSGFSIYNSKQEDIKMTQFPAFIRSVKITNIDSTIFFGTFFTKDSLISNKQEQWQIPILPNKYGNLRFSFAGAFYQAPKTIKYKFYLEGNDDKWSEWTTENYKDYSNLKPGEYTFKVKAKNVFDIESSVATFQFTIKPPWYQSIFAFIGYFIIAALLIWLIVWLYTLRLRKQKEYLEEQVKLRTKEIEQQKQEIEAQRDQLAAQNIEIQKINKDITDSIEYAKRIQEAMLPLESNIAQYLKDYFILFKPRDIVSGDFYWFVHRNDKTFIAAVDCTGHGVPGAFMSMIGAEILTTIVVNKGITDAAEILEYQNKYIRKALKQDTTDNQDGMDMALCVIDHKNKTVEFSGAKNPLFYITNGELTKIRGNRQSIGGFQFGDFTKHTLEYQTPTYFYIFSDGYADQFGGDGEKQEKFMIKRFKNLLLEIYTKPMQEQKQILDDAITDWMRKTRQTDDILVIGFKL